MSSGNQSKRREIDFDKFKMTPWKKFKRKLYHMFNLKAKGGLWVYLPSLILYPLILIIIGVSVYNVGVKTGPRAETDNLKIYSIKRDAELAKDIVAYLDPYAIQIKQDLDVSFKHPVEITINRSHKIYARNVYELQPRWPQSYSVLVTSEPGNIQMISPEADDMENMNFYTVNHMLSNAKVSLAQDYLNDLNFAFKKLPMWLTEGVPCYIVADDTDIERVRRVVKTSETPKSSIMKMDLLRSNLYSLNTDEYSSSNGREYAYVFIDFFVQKFSEEKVIAWAKSKTFNLEDTGYETYDELYKELEIFIEANYR